MAPAKKAASTKKAAAKKTAKKAATKQPETEPEEPQTVVQDAPEVEGEAYQVGFVGVSSDDEDYSVAAEVDRLSES